MDAQRARCETGLATAESFEDCLRDGLAGAPKQIACKYF